MAERLKTLAEVLGVPDPTDAEPKPAAPYEPPISAQDFALQILRTPEYRMSVMRRIIVDELPSGVETLLLHYAFGKPVERVEVNDTTVQPEQMTPAMLKERAAYLMRIVDALAEDASEPPRKPLTESRVH